MDRNFLRIVLLDYKEVSLSARRAWIEMWMKSKLDDAREVALRKESVDRNTCRVLDEAGQQASLSARRAWIEIYTAGLCLAVIASLSARRAWIEIAAVPAAAPIVPGRSPQGERG